MFGRSNKERDVDNDTEGDSNPSPHDPEATLPLCHLGLLNKGLKENRKREGNEEGEEGREGEQMPVNCQCKETWLSHQR